MFEIVSELVQIFLDLIPRFRRIDSTQAAVCVYLGRWRRVLRPGTYLYWPFIQEIQEENILERNGETSIFGATSKDGLPFQCRLAIQWQVSDVKLFHFSASCGQTFLELSAQCAATSCISGNNTKDLLANGASGVAQEAFDEIQSACADRGIDLRDLQFSLFSMTIPVLHAYTEQTAAD